MWHDNEKWSHAINPLVPIVRTKVYELPKFRF